MRHPCKLIRMSADQDERFEAVAYLADRIHELRAGRPILTKAVLLTMPGFSGAAVLIELDTFDGPGAILGWAIIGEPELDAVHQDQLLHGALGRLEPGGAAEELARMRLAS